MVGELVPILVLVSIVSIWGPADAADAELFAGQLGDWVGPIAGALTVIMVTAWAGIKSLRPVLQGVLIGLILAALDAAILVAVGAPFALLFVVSNGGKVAAGALGGWFTAGRVGSGVSSAAP